MEILQKAKYEIENDNIRDGLIILSRFTRDKTCDLGRLSIYMPYQQLVSQLTDKCNSINRKQRLGIEPRKRASVKWEKLRKQVLAVVEELNELQFAAQVVFDGQFINDRPWAGGSRGDPQNELQSILGPDRLYDPTFLRRMLIDCPARVCKIEIGVGSGTGFLVGPDLVMTNYHVMQPVFARRTPVGEVNCRFDYSSKGDGTPVGDQGKRTSRLSPAEWCIAKSEVSDWDRDHTASEPTADQLDYCILRLAERVGEDRLYGASDQEFRKRDWFRLNDQSNIDPISSQLFMFQHPRGSPLKFAIGDHRGFNTTKNRIYYDINTLPGSSGSPILNSDFELIGIHNSGWKHAHEFAQIGRKANQGIPIANIAEHLFPQFPKFPTICFTL